MTRIGTIVSRDPKLMKLLSYIVLFAGDTLREGEMDEGSLAAAKAAQAELLQIMERFVKQQCEGR